jgi:tetratricopeptide (TPR) repeat protein
VFCRFARVSLLFLIVVSSCRRDDALAGSATLAVLRFDNLSGEASLDWMARGMAEALSIELAHSQSYRMLPVSAAVPAQATAVAYGRFSGDANALRAVVAIHDLRSDKRVLTASSRGDSLLAAVRGLARQIDPALRAVTMPRPEALRLYAEALEASDAKAAMALLERATEADPAFGRAYLAAVQFAKALGNREAVERYLVAASAHAEKMDGVERAALAHERAVLKGDREGQIRALSDLARARPADAERWRALGEAENAAGRFQEAALHFGRAVELDPSDAASLNSMGYALAFAGRFDEAVEALHRYERLRPAEGNPLDSLGDVYFYFRRFADAARLYEQAHKRQPSLLNGGSGMKAALGWHAAGDPTRAEQAFQQFRERRSATPEWPLWQAQWLATTGKLGPALQLLAASGAIGRSHLIVLALEAGNRELAKKTAAAGPPSAVTLLVDPNWEARVAHAAEPARSGLSGFALMFSQQYDAAARAFDRARQASHGGDRAGYAVMQAWCVRRAGGNPDPALNRFAPVPQVQAPNPLAPLYFSRLAE